MKIKTLLVSMLAIFVAACSPSNDENAEAEAVPAPTEQAVSAPVKPPEKAPATSAIKVTDELAELSALEAKLSKIGCFACHAVDDKRIGPSYRSIAERYRGQPVTETLVGKIIKGGGGVWGPIPMTSHPHLSAEVLTPLVDQILALPSK